MIRLAQFTRFAAIEGAYVDRKTVIFIAIWVISMITLPIFKWMFGDDIVPLAVTGGLLTQFLAVLYIVVSAWGKKRTLLTVLVVAILTWTAEAIGSTTGFPFGVYEYTELLQPQLAHVPLVIPIAWFMMLAPAWAVAETIVGTAQMRAGKGFLLYVIISGLALTVWDLFLDPQMVLWGFWIWEDPQGYFGIPVVNFVGWFLVAIIVTAIVRPQRLPVVPLLAIYGIVWFLQSFGQFFFWNQQGPALVGCVGMGSILWVSIGHYRGNKR